MVILSLFEILKHPNENGISLIILGVLFVLSLYHFLLYFQHKDKAYLYYSLYTFLIFLNRVWVIKDSFISELLSEKTIAFLISTSLYIVWTYNLVYFIFAFTFLDLKSYSKLWSKVIFNSTYILLVASFIVQVLYTSTGNALIIRYGNYFFLLCISILAIMSYIPLFKMRNKLRHFIIIGSIILFVTSLTAELIYRLQIVEPNNQISYSIFYVGLIIENMFFSLGLGRKQKLVLEEKNASQAALIKQLKENEQLRETINRQLDRTVSSLNKQAEIDRLDKLNANFERELAELKVTLLRSQMNPHFIFNSLNSIKLYIINNEKEKAVYYLNKFSKLIRQILTTSQQKQISLAEEIETLELYMNIESIRFENKIDFEVNVDDSLNIDTIQVPCLFLQPFLENAIWHGLSTKKGNKELEIRIESHNKNHVKINIEDNGIGRKQSQELAKKKLHKKQSIGINLTKERLKMFYREHDHQHSLKFVDLTDSENHPLGTRVELTIPLN